MKYGISTLLILTCLHSFGQNLDNCKLEKLYHKNNKINYIYGFDTVDHCYCGIYKEFDSLGVLLIEGNYRKTDSVECKECYAIDTEMYEKGVRTKVNKVNLNYIKIGEWKYYHSNGNIKEVGGFSTKVHSFLSRPITIYDQTEEYLNENKIVLADIGPQNTGISYEDLKEGLWMYFDETGLKIKEELFIEGRLIYTKE